MKFTTESVARCSARIGKLSEIERLPNLSFETPMLLLYTKRGSVPHLTKDVFKMLTTEQQFLTTSLPTTISMTDHIKQQFESFNEYVSMPEYPFFLTIQDPSEYTQPGHQQKSFVTVWSRNGRFSVGVDRYMEIAEIFKPDMYVTLCDGDTDKESTQKRLSKALDRSKDQFEKCLQRHQESSILKNKGFLGAVEGGYNLQAREKSIKYMENASVLGYLIDGLHRNGPEIKNINIDEIHSIVEHSLNLLPVDKLRVMMGCYNPSTLLDLIHLGIDLFDSSYAYVITEEKKALTFLYDDYKTDFISLTDERYREDFEPLCKSCTCVTCKNHHKAYIHHLVQTKELLSQVLLMIHNTHHYMEFFKAIRVHIKNGTFCQFRDKIKAKCSTTIEKYL